MQRPFTDIFQLELAQPSIQLYLSGMTNIWNDPKGNDAVGP
jgi:hypothetical protein